MNAVNVGLVTFIIQHYRIQGVFLLCKITNLLIYSIIEKTSGKCKMIFPFAIGRKCDTIVMDF